jgi:hypothetical protein
MYKELALYRFDISSVNLRLSNCYSQRREGLEMLTSGILLGDPDAGIRYEKKDKPEWPVLKLVVFFRG